MVKRYAYGETMNSIDELTAGGLPLAKTSQNKPSHQHAKQFVYDDTRQHHVSCYSGEGVSNTKMIT